MNLRLAVPAIAVATVAGVAFLAAAAIDRADAADGAGALELGDIGTGVGSAVGWSPVVAGLAIWGVLFLFRRADRAGEGLWRPVLVGGLAVLPLVAILLALRARRVEYLGALSVALLALIGAGYLGRIVLQRPAPGFGWVSAFEFAHRPALFAAILLATAVSLSADDEASPAQEGQARPTP